MPDPQFIGGSPSNFLNPNSRYVYLPVPFVLPDASSRLNIEFVLDTGFEGELMLPHAVVLAMALPFIIDVHPQLADGSRTDVNLHKARIFWNGEEREVGVLAMGERPLIGTALLRGFRLCADFVPQGEVTLEGLPAEA